MEKTRARLRIWKSFCTFAPKNEVNRALVAKKLRDYAQKGTI